MSLENVYESEQMLSEYLLFHYGTAEQILPYDFGPKEALFFPVRCVEEAVDCSRLTETSTALDIACAVGRSSFELSKYCASVIGVDLSESFIAAASALAENGMLSYRFCEEGKVFREATAHVPERTNIDRLSFEVGDAQNLKLGESKFDVVLAANLLCRLPDPIACLRQMPDLVSAGGQLVFTTPCTWREEFTPLDSWLGGAKAGQDTLQTIKEELSDSFELVWTGDLPFLIREHARKFQWSVAQGSRWIRV